MPWSAVSWVLLRGRGLPLRRLHEVPIDLGKVGKVTEHLDAGVGEFQAFVYGVSDKQYILRASEGDKCKKA